MDGSDTGCVAIADHGVGHHQSGLPHILRGIIWGAFHCWLCDCGFLSTLPPLGELRLDADGLIASQTGILLLVSLPGLIRSVRMALRFGQEPWAAEAGIYAVVELAITGLAVFSGLYVLTVYSGPPAEDCGVIPGDPDSMDHADTECLDRYRWPAGSWQSAACILMFAVGYVLFLPSLFSRSFCSFPSRENCALTTLVLRAVALLDPTYHNLRRIPLPFVPQFDSC